MRGERRITERAYLYGELAQALLLRWELRRLGEDLGEALSAVENALPHERRAHLTLARILEAMADEAESGRAGADEAWWLTAKAQVRAESGGEGGTEGTGGAAVLVERTAHEVALEFLNRAHNSLALIGGIPRPPPPSAPTGGPPRWPGSGCCSRLAELEPKWTGGCLDTAVQVTDALLKEDRTADVLLLRGSLLLALAHHAVAGPGEEALLTARAYADRAAKDLYAGFETPAPGALSDAEVSRAWLDVADAVELSQAETDDATRLTVLQALDQARRYAGPDREAQAVCLLRMAKVLRERYESTRSRTHLDSAVVAWSEALELMGPDDPRRAAAFTELGDALTARARAKESVDDARGAVRALRRALDETSESDPELARRLLSAGRGPRTALPRRGGPPRPARGALDPGRGGPGHRPQRGPRPDLAAARRGAAAAVGAHRLARPARRGGRPRAAGRRGEQGGRGAADGGQGAPAAGAAARTDGGPGPGTGGAP